MDVVVLTAVCTAGLLLALFFVVRWGGLVRQPPPARDDMPLAAHLARTATIAIVGGVGAGVLVAGLGGRLVMRIAAATSGDAAQGALTEAEETVGEITLSGTLGLVVFVGLFGGIVGGLLYVLVRRWLPARAWAAGLLFGALLLVVFARLDPLSPDNVDFEILEPVWLAVLLVAALFPAFGMTAAALIERLDRSWPRHPLSFLPLLLLVPAAPFALAMLVVGGLVAAGQSAGWRAPPAVGTAVLGLVGVVAGVWFAAGVVSILT